MYEQDICRLVHVTIGQTWTFLVPCPVVVCNIVDSAECRLHIMCGLKLKLHIREILSFGKYKHEKTSLLLLLYVTCVLWTCQSVYQYVTLFFLFLKISLTFFVHFVEKVDHSWKYEILWMQLLCDMIRVSLGVCNGVCNINVTYNNLYFETRYFRN